MQMRPLGSSGIQASVIGFGAWAVGGWMWGGTEEKEAVAAIQAAIDSGVNLIDTAPIYGFGRSEEIVGKAIRDRRNKVVIATKCCLIWDGSNRGKGVHHFDSSDRAIGDKGGTTHYQVYRYLAPHSIRAEVEASLRRMGVDHIDVLQTHWQDASTPIADTAGEMLRLKEEGKIRAIGCSNATPADMDAYRAVAPLDVDQERYNMLDRGVETTNLPYCAKHKIAFFAYSPLAQGLLTGALGPDRAFSAGDQRLFKPRYTVERRKRMLVFLGAIKPVADRHGLTLGQLAAAWTIARPGCSHALLGARTPEQARENAKAGSVSLAGEEIAAIDREIERHLKGFDE